MAFFNHAFPKIFIGSGSVVGSGSHTKNLKAGQIALADTKGTTYAAGTTKSSLPMGILACGSYHTKDKLGPFHGGYMESDKTKGINPNYVSKYWVSSPSAARNHIIQIGWNGANDCTVPTFEKDTTYYLRVEAKGSPVYRTMRRNLYKTFGVNTGCSTACADVCTDSADPKAVFEAWAKLVNEDPLTSLFMRASVVKEDGGTPPGSAVAYNVYTLSYNDTGDAVALAAVQVAYSTLTIERISYTGVTSVYKVIKTGSAPSTFNSIAWVDAGYDVYKLVRDLCITMPIASDGAAEVTAIGTFLGSRADYVASSATIQAIDAVDQVGNCTATIQVSQYSNNYVSVGCDYLTAATYDNLPSYLGYAWGDCPCVTTEDLDGKYALRLEGAYTDSTFSNCSFLPEELYELAPVELQADFVDEVNDVCLFQGMTKVVIQQPKQAVGTGEELVREYITYLAYKQDPFTCDPRMREVLDHPALVAVKRNSLYKRFYFLHNVPRWSNPTSTFDNDQYLVMIAFESGVDTTNFQALLTPYLTSGVMNGVTLETH